MEIKSMANEEEEEDKKDSSLKDRLLGILALLVIYPVLFEDEDSFLKRVIYFPFNTFDRAKAWVRRKLK